MATTVRRDGTGASRPRKTAAAKVPGAPEVPGAQEVPDAPEVPGTQHPAPHARAAAEHTARHNEVRLSLPLVGKVELPPTEELAFLAGVGLLALVGAVEWPVALLLGVGHALATRRHNKILREFGEALERI